MNTKLSAATLAALFVPIAPISPSYAADPTSQTSVREIRNPAEYNLTDQVALKGYDPVSYFPEGGSSPLSGRPDLRFEFGGVIYYFATTENLNLFMATPSRYEPTYGGWCAYAMSFGSKVDIKPSIFTLHGNRLHFFVSQRAKQNFDKDVVGHEDRADGFWKQISGEEPRN